MASSPLRLIRFGSLRKSGTIIAIAVAVVACVLTLLGNPLDGGWFILRGRVIDQYGAPVPNAVVSGEIAKRVWVPFLLEIDAATNSGFGLEGRFEKLTNAAGDFSAWGFGDRIGVSFSAAGYISFERGDYDTDLYSAKRLRDLPTPVVYHIWKLSGPQPLIQSEVHVVGDGRTHWLDLRQGRTVDGPEHADLSVELHATPEHPSSGQFGWAYHLQAVGGGFARTNDLYRFLAPPSGYQPSIMYESPAARKGVKIPTDHYYLRSRNGAMYCELDMAWKPEDGVVDVSYRVNPGGSRILEPGLEKRP